VPPADERGDGEPAPLEVADRLRRLPAPDDEDESDRTLAANNMTGDRLAEAGFENQPAGQVDDDLSGPAMTFAPPDTGSSATGGPTDEANSMQWDEENQWQPPINAPPLDADFDLPTTEIPPDAAVDATDADALPRDITDVGLGSIWGSTPAEAPHSILAPPVSPSVADRTAMATVAERAEELVRHGFSLAGRNATYSARAEFLVALWMIAEARDAQIGGGQHVRDLDAGLLALREADDFVTRSPDASVNVAGLVESHGTPVLQGLGVDVSAVIARQRYYAFAQERLAQACGSEPAASWALYGMGKLHTSPALQAGDSLLLNGAKAMVYHRAALTVNPRHYLSANELGVLLARYGELEVARDVLLEALRVQRFPEAWYNLSIVHQRLGEYDLARRARYEWELARSEPVAGQPVVADQPLRWVDPGTFARADAAQVQSPTASPLTPAVKARRGVSPRVSGRAVRKPD
jgi:hypothetical protein